MPRMRATLHVRRSALRKAHRRGAFFYCQGSIAILILPGGEHEADSIFSYKWKPNKLRKGVLPRLRKRQWRTHVCTNKKPPEDKVTPAVSPQIVSERVAQRELHNSRPRQCAGVQPDCGWVRESTVVGQGGRVEAHGVS